MLDQCLLCCPPRFIQLAIHDRDERATLVVNVWHFIGRALDLALDVVLTAVVLHMRMDGITGIGRIKRDLHDQVFINALAQRFIDERKEQLAAAGIASGGHVGAMVFEIKHAAQVCR